MNIEERINRSETRIFKALFPNTTNHYDTLFGGTAMHMMDEVGRVHYIGKLMAKPNKPLLGNPIH